jgi:genome maintenance exonuclease 1
VFELELNEEDYKLNQVNNGPGGRFYQDPEENKYYSITNVLSILSAAGIAKWRARVGEEEANRVSRTAAGRGNEVHDLLESYILNEFEEGKTYLDKWSLIAKSNFRDIKPIIDDKLTKVYATEKRMYSKHLGVAGTVDCVGVWDGKISIIDWKTSAKFKKKEWISSYFMQACAYAIMWEERTGQPITQLVVAIAGDAGPQIFVEHRDHWDGQLISVINDFKSRKNS